MKMKQKSIIIYCEFQQRLTLADMGAVDRDQLMFVSTAETVPMFFSFQLSSPARYTQC